MTGNDVLQARKQSALTQKQFAGRLGVSQAYLSMLERGHRGLTPALMEKVLTLFEVAPTALPLHDLGGSGRRTEDELAKAVAALGYPGFSYMRSRPTQNPAEVLVRALQRRNLDTRVAESLPWLVLRFSDLDWRWVLREVKLHDLQNRLGFVLTLAREVADRKRDAATALKLRRLEQELQDSRLAREDTFCHEALSQAERRWLRERRSAEAAQWNLLSDLAPEHLTHAQ